MAKFTVYIGDDLEKRMSALRETKINWSSLAQAAFERAITLHELKGSNVEQGHIERLRESRKSNTERRQAEGVALGKQWAGEEAEYEDLERVAALGSVQSFDFGEENAAQAAKALTSALTDDPNPSWDDVGVAMEGVFGRMAPTLAEIEGFIEGATEIFDQV